MPLRVEVKHRRETARHERKLERPLDYPVLPLQVGVPPKQKPKDQGISSRKILTLPYRPEVTYYQLLIILVPPHHAAQ